MSKRSQSSLKELPVKILRFGYDFLSLPIMSRTSDAWLNLRFNSISLMGSKNIEQPKVTIVVPVYNVERYLATCLNSLRAQRYCNLETIVVDDGSTDASFEIAKSFESKMNLRIIQKTNAGLGAARNTGVEAIAKTDFLMFLDSDDALAPNAIRTMVSLISETKSDFVVGDVTRMKGVTRLKRIDTRALYRKGTQKATVFADQPNAILDVTAWNKFFDFKFYLRAKIMFPTDVFFEDMTEMTKAYIAANKFDVLAKTIYLWRVRTEGSKSITQQTSDAKKLEDRLLSLRQIKKMLKQAVKVGKATNENIKAFKKRVRKHDLKLYEKTTANAKDIFSEFL